MTPLHRANPASRQPSKRTGADGFTLVEVMIALTIMVSVLAMASGFLVESTLINFKSTAKNNINRELRNTINRMAIEAKQSNFFLIYESAEDGERYDRDDRRRPNESGDALLLVFKSGYPDMEGLGMDPLRDPRPITRVILYYRDPNTEIDGVLVGPVMRWEKDFTNSPVTDPEEIREVEMLLPPFATLRNESRQVMAFSEGLVNGRLFYNFQNRTIMINGRILHGNQAKWVTDTYNFSISPRG
ncbi:MAG: prepilin-type N-terminal cleavage/methylation domain-containing protein [Kiritimatiellae bacterium]|nr:prepilin-type N-terminal cleavage/methylation domain-containing protein [Kiritimatiellia bacterium]